MKIFIPILNHKTLKKNIVHFVCFPKKYYFILIKLTIKQFNYNIWRKIEFKHK